jgi:hypothetical protein
MKRGGADVNLENARRRFMNWALVKRDQAKFGWRGAV